MTRAQRLATNVGVVLLTAMFAAAGAAAAGALCSGVEQAAGATMPGFVRLVLCGIAAGACGCAGPVLATDRS